MIIPQMKGSYEDALLRSTSRELVSMCDLTSSHAISLNQPLLLQFDQKTGRYAIVPLPSRRGPQATREVPGGQGQLDARISIEFHKTTGDASTSAEEESPPTAKPAAPSAPQAEGITFYPDGTADPAEIVLRDRDGFRLALRINPVTARVRIIELARE